MEKIFGKIKSIDLENKIVEVVASTEIIDRQGERILQSGWELENYLKNPVVLWAHKYSELPIGKALKVWVEDGKLKAKIQFANHKFANEIWELVKEKYLRAVSVGFRVLEDEGKDIKKAELYEISFVPVPANPEALVQLGYSEEEAKDLEKKVAELLELYKKEVEKEAKWEICGSRNLPTKEESSWDGAKARKEMERWANGDMEKYKKGFVVRDASKKENLTAYKLPFARVRDGKLYATWGGVRAAMGAVLGARGGIKIPEDVRKRAYNFLAGYYKKFDREAPEYKQYSEEELEKVLDGRKLKKVIVMEKEDLKEIIREVVQEFFKEERERKEKKKEIDRKKLIAKINKEELLKEMIKHLREADKQVGLGLRKAKLYQDKIELLKKIKSYYRKKGGEKNGGGKNSY